MARIKGGLEQMRAKTREITDVSGAMETEIMRIIETDKNSKT